MAADVWSVTSYNELRREALAVERWNRLHPDQPERHAVHRCRRWRAPKGRSSRPRDYMKVVADQIAPWLPGRMETLGTDGFGRSDNREYLRRHFEINAESIAAAALSRLARDGKFDAEEGRSRRSPSWAWIPRRSTPRGHSAPQPTCKPANASRRRDGGQRRAGGDQDRRRDWRGIPRRWWPTGWNPRRRVRFGLRAAGADAGGQAGRRESSLRPRPRGDADRPADRAGADGGRGADLAISRSGSSGQPHQALAQFVVWPLLVSLAAKTGLATIKFRYGRRLQSDALTADAWNDAMDTLSALAALIAVGLTLADAVRFRGGGPVRRVRGGADRGFRRHPRGARDRDAADGHDARRAADDGRSARRREVPGVRGVEKCFARKTGLQYHVDLHLEVDPEMTVRQSHEIAHEVRRAFGNGWIGWRTCWCTWSRRRRTEAG